MRCSWLAVLLLAGSCTKQQTAGFRRVTLLPIENLSADSALDLDAVALRLGIWDALQAQGTVFPTLAGHRRDLPELQSAFVLDGYVAAGRFQLRLNDEPVVCAGKLEDCAGKVAAEIAAKVGVTARPAVSANTLRQVGRSMTPDGANAALADAADADPGSAMVWLAWAGQEGARGGAAASLAVLARAPLGRMTPYDSARVRARVAELQQDRKGHLQAMLELARTMPADIELQERTAQEATGSRNFAAAGEIYDRMLAIAQPVPLLNQAAYVAAYQGDRAKAERLASTAKQAAPNDPQFTDTRGEIAYYFGDFPTAAQNFEQAANLNAAFLGGLEFWKAADATLLAGHREQAEAYFQRFAEVRTKAGMRNTLLLQSVWDLRSGREEEGIAKLQAATNSTERGKALFLLALVALHRRDFGAAERFRREIDGNAIEGAFLRSLIENVPPPAGFPVPAEAITALHLYLRGDVVGAGKAFAVAKEKLDPRTEGQWRKFDAMLAGRKAENVMPASPDDWLAVLLR